MLCQECTPRAKDDAYVLLIGRAEIESFLIHTKQHALDLAREHPWRNTYMCVNIERARPSVIERFPQLV